MDRVGQPMRIVGYADRLSVRAGDQVGFHISSEYGSYRPEIVRLRRPGSDRHGAPLAEEPVPADLPSKLAGRAQVTTSGSYAEGVLAGELNATGLGVWFWPTRPHSDARPLCAVGELVLEASADGLTLRVGELTLAALTTPIPERAWGFAAATVDGSGSVRLELHRPGRPASTVSTHTEPIRVGPGYLRLGSDGRRTGAIGHTFNGKLARPVVSAYAWPEATTAALATGMDPVDLLERETISVLDLASDPGSARVPDRGGLTKGATLHHLPGRGVPGPFWTGQETDFRLARSEFDAIHLHDDDLTDAGWQQDLIWTVPPETSSGAYALKVTAGSDVDRIPFVVTPATHQDPVLVVLPTWTYLAYANWRTYAEHEVERVQAYQEHRACDVRDRWLARHPEFGRSLYDVHSDGSGVFCTSLRRPIVNLRPDYFTPSTRGYRHLAQDLLLLNWLDNRAERYAVVTDDEVEHGGAKLLANYRVVLTGSHPEYCSARMLDAYTEYTYAGGRLMYLGGNGFYQVTARHPAHRDALEIRRGHAGVATWVSDPGEEHLSATGERGGLWRLRGRPPNVLAGVGFTAQGHDYACGYRRTEASKDPAVSWVFDGVNVDAGEVFGDIGPGLGGAAGDELDRADHTLGTPADAVVLASSTGHSDRIALVPEEADHTFAAQPAGPHPKVRADIVLFGRPGGGAVFSVGSIAWSTAMSHGEGDNDTARVTANVLDCFRDEPGPILDARESCTGWESHVRQ